VCEFRIKQGETVSAQLSATDYGNRFVAVLFCIFTFQVYQPHQCKRFQIDSQGCVFSKSSKEGCKLPVKAL